MTKQIEGTKGYAADKNAKDGKIQRRHLLKMKRDYYIGKLQRFEMKEVPTGFSNRQGVDIGIIGKYAKLYLHTVFDKIFVVKGATTAAFRKVWGLQSVYEKKERINHVHHCVDAITIACIGKSSMMTGNVIRRRKICIIEEKLGVRQWTNRGLHSQRM